MGFKQQIVKKLDGEAMKSLQGLTKEFSNIENKILTVQENQVEFEKYLEQILKNQKEILKIIKNEM